MIQEDFLRQNISQAVEKIENGEKEEFPFRKSHKLSFNFFQRKSKLEMLRIYKQ